MNEQTQTAAMNSITEQEIESLAAKGYIVQCEPDDGDSALLCGWTLTRIPDRGIKDDVIAMQQELSSTEDDAWVAAREHAFKERT